MPLFSSLRGRLQASSSGGPVAGSSSPLQKPAPLDTVAEVRPEVNASRSQEAAPPALPKRPPQTTSSRGRSADGKGNDKGSRSASRGSRSSIFAKKYTSTVPASSSTSASKLRRSDSPSLGHRARSATRAVSAAFTRLTPGALVVLRPSDKASSSDSDDEQLALAEPNAVIITVPTWNQLQASARAAAAAANASAGTSSSAHRRPGSASGSVAIQGGESSSSLSHAPPPTLPASLLSHGSSGSLSNYARETSSFRPVRVRVDPVTGVPEPRAWPVVFEAPFHRLRVKVYYHRLPVGDVAPDGKRRNNRKAAGGLSSDGEVTNAVDATKAKEEDKEAKEAGEGSANASQEGKEDVGPDESDDGVPCWTYVAHRTTHPIIREVTMTILCRHVDTAAPGSLATVAGRWPPVATASASAGAREDPSSASMAAAVTEKGSGRPPLHPSLRFPLDPLAYFESLCEVASGRFWREPLHELGGNATLLGFGRPHVNVTHAPTTGVGGNRRHSYTPGSTAASSGGGGTATVLFVPVSRRRALRMLGRDVQLSGTVFERRVAVLLTAEEARVARGWGVVRVLGLLAERAVARTWEERVRGELPRAGASVIDGEAEQKEGVESKVESKKDEDDDENGAADGDASGSGNGDGTSSHSTADEGAINTARFPIWVEPNRPSLLTAAEMEDSTKGMDEGMVQIFVPGIRVFRVRTLGAKKSAAAETSIEMTVDADVDDDADTEDDGDGPRQPTATRRPASTPGTTTIALRITRMVRHREQFQHLFASLSPMSTVAIDSTWYEDANGVLTWNRDNDAAPSVVRFAGTEAEEREELCVGSLIVGPRVAAAKPGDAEGVNDPMEGRDVVSYYEDGVRLMLTPRTWADLRAAIAKEAYYTTELVGPPPAPSRESPAAYDQAPGKVTFMLIWDGESQRPRPMLARPDPVAERFRVLNPEVGQVEFVRVLDPEPVVYRRRQHAGGAPGFPTPVSSGATGLKNLTTAAIMKPKTAGVANGSPVGASQPGVTSEQQPAATTAAEGHADKALSQADEATPDAGKNGAPAAPQTTPAPAASEPDPKMVAALEAAQLRAAVLLHGALVSLVPAQNPLGPHDTGKGLCVLVELPARILHANDDDDKLQVKKDEELTGWARIVGMRNTLGLDWRLVEAALASVPWGPASRDEALVLKQMEKSAMVFQAKLEAEKSRDEKPGENATEKSVAGANTEAEVGQNEVDVKKEEQHEKQLGSRADVVDADADPSAKGKVKESGSELEPDPKPDPKTAVAMNTGRALKEGTIRFQLVFGLWNWEDDDSFA